MNSSQSPHQSNNTLDDILKELEERFGVGNDDEDKKPNKKNARGLARFTQNQIIGGLTLILLVVGAAVGVFLGQQNQENRQQAFVPYDSCISGDRSCINQSDGQPCFVGTTGGTCVLNTSTGNCTCVAISPIPTQVPACDFCITTPDQQCAVDPIFDPNICPSTPYCPKCLDHTGTPVPTKIPSQIPTATFTFPTSIPTATSVISTPRPTNTFTPSLTPTRTPTNTPTRTPTATSSRTPTPTNTPTSTPSRTPTATSSRTPTPTNTSTVSPSKTPTNTVTPPVSTATFTTAPTATIVVGPTCNSIVLGYPNGGDQNRPPKVDDIVNFTCAKGPDTITKYQFRVINPFGGFDNTMTPPGNSNISLNYTIKFVGKYKAQCRWCTGIAPNFNCQAWENPALAQ